MNARWDDMGPQSVASSGQDPTTQRSGSVATRVGSEESPGRRHDLDALRGCAMLLGIVLHATLSFAPIPWTVQDSQQSDFYYVLFACIHGFRMPLFFMLSGFFTAMLWRRRGLASLVGHRLRRVALPLVIGCLTIVPAMWVVSIVATRPSPGSAETSPLFAAVVAGDITSVRAELQSENSGRDTLDSLSGSSPLCTAVFLGRTDIVKLLLDANADVNQPNRDMATPLHIAVFMGRSKEAALLLEAGANVDARDGTGATPQELLNTDFGTTNFIASSLGVPLEEDTLMAGRQEIAQQLGTDDYLGATPDSRQAANWRALYGLLFQLPVFMHLWFLWFLCWLIAAFLVYAVIANLVPMQRIPRWLVCSPASLVWLIPLTMLPQFFMQAATFGPDSSVGFLPIPSVIIYYAVFFFFGAVYWEMDDEQGQLGKHWYFSLPVALLVIFPVAFDLVSGTFGMVPQLASQSTKVLIANFLQAAFAWLMTFGSIGLCRRLLSRESKALRYISDSSYWLYLTHLPLVILAQWLVRDLPLPAFVKFAGITILVSIFLFFTYAFGVRHTLIGRLLNGPRIREPQKAESGAELSGQLPPAAMQ